MLHSISVMDVGRTTLTNGLVVRDNAGGAGIELPEDTLTVRLTVWGPSYPRGKPDGADIMHAIWEHGDDGCTTKTLAGCIDRSMQGSLIDETICLFDLLYMVLNPSIVG